MRPTRMWYRPGAWDVSNRFFRGGEMLLLHHSFLAVGHAHLPCSPYADRVAEWSAALLGSVLTDITL
jgi:hypothetical protein